jgi:hypothetical protein
MAKKKDEELPKEETPEEGQLPEAPNLTPSEAPKGDIEAQCNQIQAVVDKAKDALRNGSALGDVVKSLIDTLTEMAGAEETNLGGLGMPSGATPPEETA